MLMSQQIQVQKAMSLIEPVHIKFTVYGNPLGLKRHRTVRVKGKDGGKDFTRTYDPSAGDKADFVAAVQKNRPPKPIKVASYLFIEAYHQRPQGHYRTGKLSHLLKDNAPTIFDKTPDCDNILKFVMDGLNGIHWVDDKLIGIYAGFHFYSDTPRITVRTGEIELTDDWYSWLKEIKNG